MAANARIKKGLPFYFFTAGKKKNIRHYWM